MKSWFWTALHTWGRQRAASDRARPTAPLSSPPLGSPVRRAPLQAGAGSRPQVGMGGGEGRHGTRTCTDEEYEPDASKLPRLHTWDLCRALGAGHRDTTGLFHLRPNWRNFQGVRSGTTGGRTFGPGPGARWLECRPGHPGAWLFSGRRYKSHEFSHCTHRAHLGCGRLRQAALT